MGNNNKILFCFIGIVQHLQNFSDPAQQLRLIRILMMVPIYSFFSYLGMVFNREAIYLDAVSFNVFVSDVKNTIFLEILQCYFFINMTMRVDLRVFGPIVENCSPGVPGGMDTAEYETKHQLL